MENWLEKMESSSGDEEDEDSFETLIEKLRSSRKKEARVSEEKVSRMKKKTLKLLMAM